MGEGKFKNSASCSCFGFSVANCVSFYVHNSKYDEEYKLLLYRKENRNRQTIKRAILRALRNRWYHKHDYHFGLTRFIQRQSLQRRRGTWTRCRNSRVLKTFFFPIIRVRHKFFCEERTNIIQVLQGDQKVSVHLIITIEKFTSNVQRVLNLLGSRTSGPGVTLDSH